MARMVAAAETWPCAVEEAALGGVGLAMDQRERQIAAEDGAALARQPVGQARANEPTPAIAITPSAMQAMNT